MNRQSIAILLSITAWAWLCQTWIAAMVLLLGVALHPLISARWHLNRKQYYRFTDLSVVLLLLSMVWAYLVGMEGNPIFVVLERAPVIVAPILFAQLYGANERLPPGALFYAMRGAPPETMADIDFRQPYALITLLAASSSNAPGVIYFVLAAGLIAWLLVLEQPGWKQRTLRLLIVAIAVALAYPAQQQLKALQQRIEDEAIAWLSESYTDPFVSRTAIGDIGRLKQSNRIQFRVRAQQPMLLLQTSYSYYLGKEWSASSLGFEHYRPAPVNASDPSLKSLEVFQSFGRDSMLALPPGPVSITGLENSRLQHNGSGSIKVLEPPGQARYQVFYNGLNQWPNEAADLTLPEQHRDWLQAVALELDFANKSPNETRLAIRDYFKSGFRYSLFTPHQSSADEALRNFMQKRKAGHCEYFAAASVFLLRQAGIPARLANGFSMQEFDEDLGLYTVRARHAHAWALAYIDGRWLPLDATPSQWAALESEQSSVFAPLADWLSRQWFRFELWRADPTSDDERNRLLIGAMALLALYLGYLAYRNRKTLVRRRAHAAMKKLSSDPGLDSEFYRIIERLEERLPPRAVDVSLNQWIAELSDTRLSRLLFLHYRLRFDPQPLTELERRELRETANTWLREQG